MFEWLWFFCVSLVVAPGRLGRLYSMGGPGVHRLFRGFLVYIGQFQGHVNAHTAVFREYVQQHPCRGGSLYSPSVLIDVEDCVHAYRCCLK